MNLTDVDDKTIKGARAAGLPLQEYTQTYKDAFFTDLQALNIERAEHYPAATDHVPEMIALIETLFQKGYAYHSDDGSVYFNISRFKPYGRLARLDLAGLKPGARIVQDRYLKDNAADFALWKAWTPGTAMWFGIRVGAWPPRLAYRMLGHEHEISGLGSICIRAG